MKPPQKVLRVFIISSVFVGMASLFVAKDSIGKEVAEVQILRSDTDSLKVNIDQAIAAARKFLREKGYSVEEYAITQFFGGSKIAPDWRLWFKKEATLQTLIANGYGDPQKPLDLAFTNENSIRDQKTGEFRQALVSELPPLPKKTIDEIIKEARELAAKQYSLNSYFISDVSCLRNRLVPRSPAAVWVVSFAKYNPSSHFAVLISEVSGKKWIDPYPIDFDRLEKEILAE